jgi:hypothetical protein
LQEAESVLFSPKSNCVSWKLFLPAKEGSYLFPTKNRRPQPPSCHHRVHANPTESTYPCNHRVHANPAESLPPLAPDTISSCLPSLPSLAFTFQRHPHLLSDGSLTAPTRSTLAPKLTIEDHRDGAAPALFTVHIIEPSVKDRSRSRGADEPVCPTHGQHP